MTRRIPGIRAGLRSYAPSHLALSRYLIASGVLAIYARFAHFRFGEADDMHAGQPSGEMDFDADAWCADAGQRTAVNDRDRHDAPPAASNASPASAHAAGTANVTGRYGRAR